MKLSILNKIYSFFVKKPIYFYFFIFFVILFIFFLIKFTIKPGTKKLFEDFFVKNKNVLSDVDVLDNLSTCNTSDSVEFYKYKDIDKNFEKNNKFGLYIYAEYLDYLEIAQNLVNSNGGEWGYVLIPYNVKDRDTKKWEEVFSRLNQKKLIPVIQLWDVDVSMYKSQTKNSAQFLNKLVWPIRPKYISVYNEVNDSNFWYGYVDPKEYAEILNYTIDTFKQENEDFFIMNGAFNVSASDNNVSMDSFKFMNLMNNHIPGIFNKLDGWASHSYPQPNFSGSPYDTGRWSIRAYIDELNYLKNTLNVQKDLPVFITETGWAHAEGENYDSSFYPVAKIADFFKIAYQEYWLKDSRVRAVMPFTVRYKAPYDHFSWINKDGVSYLHYEVLKSLPKVKGEPPILEKESFNFTYCE